MGLQNVFWKDLGPNVSATMKSRPETQIIHSVITHVDILNVNHSEFVLLKRMVQLVVSVGMDLWTGHTVVQWNKSVTALIVVQRHTVLLSQVLHNVSVSMAMEIIQSAHQLLSVPHQVY